MADDAARAFLQSLPEIRKDESFWFACHPGVRCFNACCSDLTMPLTPYDVLRLCTGLGMGSEAFFEEFAVVGCYEDTGLPLLHLRMEDSPRRLCPFVTEAGCGVYADRSSACRTYPLGRATMPRTAPDAGSEESGPGTDKEPDVIERYFLVREDHCLGFAESRELSIDAWLADQGLEPYNRMNDRYMRLIARYKDAAKGALLPGRLATMALMCLYQQDRFLEFLRSMNLFQRITLTGKYSALPQERHIEAILGDPEQRLLFAFDWVELVLLGSSPDLAPSLAPEGS